jgi:hypothetical protein
VAEVRELEDQVHAGNQDAEVVTHGSGNGPESRVLQRVVAVRRVRRSRSKRGWGGGGNDVWRCGIRRSAVEKFLDLVARDGGAVFLVEHGRHLLRAPRVGVIGDHALDRALQTGRGLPTVHQDAGAE